MLGKAHLSIGCAIGLAVARHAGADTNWTTWLVVPIAILAAGLPDVLDSENAEGRGAMGLSWKQIRYERESIARQSRKALKRGQFGFLEAIITLIVGWAMLFPRVLLAFLLDGIVAIIPHRGPTHWLVTNLLLTALVGAGALLTGHKATSPAVLAFGLGYLSHLVSDGLTHWGNTYFGPFWNKRFHLLPKPLRFRYDSPIQWLFVLATYVAVMFFWYPEIPAFAVTIVKAAIGGF